jgi:hypothetical protein
MKLVTESTNQDGELYWSFRNAFNSICMKYDQDQQKVVARYYVKKESLKGVNPETVIDAMMRKNTYRKKIQTGSRILHSYTMMEWISSISFKTLMRRRLKPRKKLVNPISGHSFLTGLAKEGEPIAHL